MTWPPLPRAGEGWGEGFSYQNPKSLYVTAIGLPGAPVPPFSFIGAKI